MTINRKIKLFEGELEGLQFLVAHFPRQGEVEILYKATFPRMHEMVGELKAGLNRIGMFDRVHNGLLHTEELVKKGQYEEAQDYVLELNRELMEASGTAEALRKRYPPKQGSSPTH